MKRLISDGSVKKLLLLLVVTLLAPTLAQATGPRVTTALFSANENEIHAVNLPPFISSEVIEGGVVSELVRTVLKGAGIDAAVTTHPVKRMVMYYLLQENALAVLGQHWHFSEEEKKELIFIPLTVMQQKHYYYKPAHPGGLILPGEGIFQQELTYGAQRGEATAAYEKAGVKIKHGRVTALLKKLKSTEVDFVTMSPLTVEWLLDRYMKVEKENYVSLDGDADTEIMYIVFNRKHAIGEVSAQKFSNELSRIMKNGVFKKIIEKHLGKGDAGKLYLRDLATFQ